MYDVYLITNRINGKRYVGITCRGYQARFQEHINEAMNGSKTMLHNAIRKYGSANFDLMLLESNVESSDICAKEKYYIKLYNTFYPSRIGYNMTEGGDGICGYAHTKEVKQRISNSLKGHKYPESRNQKIQEAMTGREYKPEWRAALSQSRLGRFTGSDNPFYGKHHSAETLAKISEANSKRKVVQLDKTTGKVLNVFNNLEFAGRYVVDNNLSNAKPTTCSVRIGEVCRNKNDSCTAYGFRWSFEERSID